jgi:signal transduction histidine kinase
VPSQLASRAARTVSPGRRDVAIDAAVAAAVFGLSLLLLAARGNEEPDARTLDLLGVGLAAMASLPLVARRRFPLEVFALTAGVSVAIAGLDYPTGPPLGPTVALFFLALNPENARAPTWLTAAIVVGFLGLHAGAVGLADDELPVVPILFGLLLWGGAWVVGDRVRLRRERVAELEERARRAERETERERRLAAAEERTRIARDLHDSAGHAINVILVQAGAARLLGQRDPERAQAALETIEEVARETLGEIDQLVRALREDDLAAQRGTIEPPPGLDALETLLERHRSAGLAVSVRTQGERRALPPGLDQAAFRILQEALTNAARHGDGSAEIDLTFGPTALELTVENPSGPEASEHLAGHGIVGMRERAALLGGRLETGPSDGRFRVRASLPYGGDGA